MLLAIIAAFLSLMGLLALHEFGHFILAKRFGVKVEEFGIGYPPRLWGKKIGETIYSLNLLPFGAFVRLPGEIGKAGDSQSFSAQPVSKRALIAFAGVLSFWLIAAILFSIVFGLGAPLAIGDEENSGLKGLKVQITGIAAHSPAQVAGMKSGDTIKQFTINNQQLTINKVKELQELTEQYKGQEVILTIERGKETFDVKLVPRVSPPKGEGPMGIGLVRTAIKSYPWYQAPWQGITATINLTGAIIQGYWQAIANLFKGLPAEGELVGPVGIFHLFTQAFQMGVNYFLNFVGMIAIYIAIFNILPIPSVDGGKLLFLGIEAARKKPLSEKIEQNVTAICFGFLIILMVLVTIKDIARIF